MHELSDNYLSSSEAAKMLGLHPNAIQKLIYSRKIPAERIAYRWMISRTFLEEFAKTYRPQKGWPRKKPVSKSEEQR